MSINPSSSHDNAGYSLDPYDRELKSSHHDYIDPSEWINQPSTSDSHGNPYEHQQSGRDINFWHQPDQRQRSPESISMELINALPSRSRDYQAEHTGDSGTSGVTSDSKHATLHFHSALRRRDFEEDYMYNVLISDQDTSEEHVKEVLRNMNQSLTLKRSVKARISRSHSQREQQNVPCSKRLTSRIQMGWKHLQRYFRELTHSLDLWHSHLKTIQGHFGSGVASYFFFLRWLFFLNFFGFIILVSFLVTPQLIWQDQLDPNKTIHPQFTGWEILTGTHRFENTVMYYGFYTTESIGNYSMPEAYLFGSSAYIIFSILLLTYSLAKSYKRNYIVTSGELKNVYANKIFSAWDYSIEKEEAARRKARSIYNELLELLTNETREEEEKTLKQKLSLYFWRTFVNFIILAIVSATAYLVFFLLKNKYVRDVNIPVLSEMTLSLVVTSIVYIVPLLFSALSYWENYSNKQTQLYLNMFRIVLLRVVILGVVTYFWLDGNKDTKLQVVKEKQCWETELGQEVYRLIMVDLFCVLFFSTLVMELGRRLIFYHCLTFVGNPEFDIAQNILDLVYTQMLTWVGFFYCPLLPMVTVLKLVVIFYTKRVSVVLNCQPSQKPWRAGHAQTVFLFLTFFNFFLALVSLGYSILQIKPSEGCGPFKEMVTRYEVVLNIMNATDSAEFLDYLLSPSIVAGLLIFLCVVVYYMRATAKANKEMVDLLRDQLILEGKDKVFLLRLYDGAMQFRNMSIARRNKLAKGAADAFLSASKRNRPNQQTVVNEIYEDYEPRDPAESKPTHAPNHMPGRWSSETPETNQPKPGWGRERTPDFIATNSSCDSLDFEGGQRPQFRQNFEPGDSFEDIRRSSQRNSPFNRTDSDGVNERRGRRRQGPPAPIPLVPHAQGFQYLTSDSPSYSPTRRNSRNPTPQRF